MAIQFPHTGIFDEKQDNNAVVFGYGLYIKKILVTGANGQLGNEIRLLAEQYTEFDFDFTDINELDLCHPEAVLDYCEKLQPAYIINCAAYTAVDKAEDDVELCYKVNRDAVENLAKAATAVGARILHVSTDYVFDGSNTTPYMESDPVCPASVYGKSKLEGENVLRQYCPDSVIVRTAWLYSTFGNNFVKTMLRLGKEKETISVVTDQIGSPTYAGDLALALMKIVSDSECGRFQPGIYHYSNEGVCSWFEFTLKIHELASITTCKVLPVLAKDYPSKVNRPAYSVLSKLKIKTNYGLSIPNWETSLAACISKLS
jgi:dTDP-4-dehydrorhamnose reductase